MAFDSPIPDFELPGVLPLGEVEAPKEKPGSWIDWDAKARLAKELIDAFWKSYEAELERDPQSGRCCGEVPADKACSSSGK